MQWESARFDIEGVAGLSITAGTVLCPLAKSTLYCLL